MDPNNIGNKKVTAGWAGDSKGFGYTSVQGEINVGSDDALTKILRDNIEQFFVLYFVLLSHIPNVSKLPWTSMTDRSEVLLSKVSSTVVAPQIMPHRGEILHRVFEIATPPPPGRDTLETYRTDFHRLLNDSV